MIRTIAPNPNRALFGRCTACAVRSLSVCGALDATDLVEFERIARHVHLTPNEALFTAGQAATSVHNITAGVARLYKLLPDGRRQVIGFALPGDFLGTMPSDRYGFSADAIEAVSVCRFPADAFAQFIEQRPHFLLRINEFAARELMLAQEQMLLLGRRTAEEKVAAFLVGWRTRLTYRRPAANHHAADEPAGYCGLSGVDDRNREPDIDPVRARKDARYRQRWRSLARRVARRSHGRGVKEVCAAASIRFDSGQR
jgi:CRP/FNR family transcriptional regulator, anaerobic regulatory protein